MAKIPMGGFGFKTPQSADVTPTAQPDMQVGAALQGAGNQAVVAGSALLADARYENKLAAERAAQAQTTLASVNIQNGLADEHDAIKADVLSGKMNREEATKRWQTSSAKVVSDNIAAVPADRAPLLSAQAKGIEGKLTNGLNDVFRVRDNQDAIAGVNATEEGLQRLAARDLPGAIKQQSMLIDGSPLPPDQKAARKQKFVEAAYFNDFRRQAQGAMQTGTTEALDQVQARLAGPEGDTLDPAKRNQLDQTIFGWKQSIEARAARDADKAEREQTKRFNTATDTINKGKDIALGGGFLAPEYIATMVEQSAGIPELQGEVKQLLESQKQVAGFASMPPAQRTAMLEGLRGQRADPKQGIDPLGQKQLERAEQIDAGLRNKVDAGEAWSAAQSVGIVKTAPLLNIANPQEALKVFQQRMSEIGDVEAWTGKKVSPLQPPEAEQLSKMLRALPPDQAASMLGQIGQVVGDADRIAAVARQLDDKGDVLGMAMLLTTSKTDKGKYTAERLLEGAQNIRDKTVKVDGLAETGWRSEITKQIRGAYSNAEVETKMIEAAFLVRASNAYKVDNESAVNMVTGGIVERNGSKLPMPFGMKEADFDKRIAAITPETLAPQLRGAQYTGPEKVAGRIEPGNIDLNNRPQVKNADGTISTVRSLGVNVGGQEVLIPTVSPDGKILSDDDAVKLYRKTGQHLGKFSTPEASTAYAESLHNEQDATYTRGGGFVLAGPTRIPVADFVKSLPDARLVHAGQGLYSVRAGNQLVTNERGQRIILKVSP